MDKQVILAVAGSGKTATIIDSLDPSKRTLLITYTDTNTRNLRDRVLRKYGCFPNNIRLLSYFTFLYGFCFKPFLWRECGASGINWQVPPAWTLKLSRSDRAFYFDGHGRLYHNRIAKLLLEQRVVDLVNLRIEKYFDLLLVDELQDLAGHDFNLLGQLAKAQVSMLFVGDFYQHTYDTSRDGNVNQGMYDDLAKYTRSLEEINLRVDTAALDKSYRCSPSVCAFISTNLGSNIASNRTDSTLVRVVDSPTVAQKLFTCDHIVKLFYKEHYLYSCYSQNWGASKGEDGYGDVCVVLNMSTAANLVRNRLRELSPQTRNKLYVACTRARGDLYLVPEDLIRQCSPRCA